jgi:serine/threonine protein kinase
MRACRVCRRCYASSVVYCSEDDHPLLEELDLSDPEMVTGYRLEVLLKAGRSDSVFRARQTASDGVCLIRIAKCPEEYEQEFLHEGRSAAAFFHPNVVDVYEAGKLDSGELYTVSEYTQGRTLREFLHTTPTPDLLTTVQIARQTAEALHAINLKGLVHRAVNTENIVLSFDDLGRSLVRIKDIDFGGARTHSIISNEFLADSALDSLRYFAPEQCDGEVAGMKTDIYSLGIVLYEMLAGSPPFNASKAAGLIELHRHRQPPEIRIDNFDLRMLLTHTLTEALQKQPRLRQSSANAVARQLRHIEQLATHVSTPPPAGIVPPLPARSVPRVAVNLPYMPMTLNTSADVVSEPNPVIGLDVFSEPIEIHSAASSEMRVDTPKPAVEVVHEGPPDNDFAAAPNDRSRLKLHRRRVHKRTLEIQEISTVKPGTALETGGENELRIVVDRSDRPPVPREPEKPVETAPQPVPTRIEWQTPDEDIPSIDDVIAVLANEASAASSATAGILSEPLRLAGGRSQPGSGPAQPQTTVSVGPDRSALSPLRTSAAHRPSETGLVAAPDVHRHNIEKAKPPAADRPISRPSAQPSRKSTSSRSETKRKSLDRPEPDEITVVTARRRPIRIDIERPAPKRRHEPERRIIPQATDEIGFSPTLLGSNADNATQSTFTSDGMFLSDYSSILESRPTFARRSATIGGGLILVISLFLFGGRFLRLDVFADRDRQPIAATTISTQGSLPTPNTKISAKDARTARLPNEKPKAPSNEDKKAKGPERNEDPTRTTATANPLPPRPKPQQIVIAGREPTKTPASAPVKTAELTRPRIVADPKP